MQVEWEKSSIQELDVTATDLSTECLIDMLTRIPGLRFLSAGQLNSFNDNVLKAWTELGNTRNLIALDLDSSDNLSDDALHKFLSRHGHQLYGLALSGMPHITDQLWQSVLPILTNAKWAFETRLVPYKYSVLMELFNVIYIRYAQIIY